MVLQNLGSPYLSYLGGYSFVKFKLKESGQHHEMFCGNILGERCIERKIKRYFVTM